MAQVMVVEPDPAAAREIQVALRLLRHTVVGVVGTGEEAVREATASRPDLVLLAIGASGDLSSVEAARALRDTLDIPVVYLYSDSDTLSRAQTSHPFGYLYKPVHAELLAAIVETALYKHRMERTLKQREQWFATTLRCIGDAVIATDAAGRIAFLNPGAEALTGWSHADAFDAPLTDVLRLDPPLAALGASAAPTTAPTDGRGVPAHDALLVARDGTTIAIEHSSAPIQDDNGAIAGTVVVFRDVTARRHAEQDLARRALYDPLTNLPNRTLLHERLQQAILTASRPNTPLALLLMDLDRFKEVNDTFGHHVGDLLLQTVAARLQGVVRPADTFARLGGDEFAVLLPNTDVHGATTVAAKLLDALEQPLVLEGHALNVGASIGIALCPAHGDTAATLLRCADVAMYVAKRRGGGYALYSAQQDEHTPGRLALMNALRNAIEHDELVLHYQPEIACGTGRLTGVEALVRWQHPERGLLPPEEFIPLAEYTGLIKPLSLWVLRTALRECRRWQAVEQGIPIAVNLSLRNLQDPDLPTTIAALLERYGVPPGLLVLELSESAIMMDPTRTIAMLTRLRAMGVQLAIDDFGAGYSSLSHIKRLPVTQLKIDPTFVRDLTVEVDDAAILRSIIDLSQHLGIRAVAEGVEDEATWELLVALGCHEAQGYHLSRPLSVTELVTWLDASPARLPAPAASERPAASGPVGTSPAGDALPNRRP